MMFTWIGELLTTKEARRRQKIYDEHASRYGISSALLVVREHLPSGKACLRMNIDATRVGNVARFINHSCDGGNLSTVLVRRSGALLPRLCFFASKVIQEGEELTFSYGEIRLRSEGLPCFCGSSCCFGILPSENTWWSSKLRVEQESIAILIVEWDRRLQLTLLVIGIELNCNYQIWIFIPCFNIFIYLFI